MAAACYLKHLKFDNRALAKLPVDKSHRLNQRRVRLVKMYLHFTNLFSQLKKIFKEILIYNFKVLV